jgi:hypothetical protein
MYQIKYLSQEAASVPPVYEGVRKEIPRHESLLTYNIHISK